jgi:tetratricopeptide (TPR) repeat protein
LKAQSFQNYAGALADYNQAIVINPKFPEAYGARGYLKYKDLGDRPGGIADTRKAAKLAREQGNTQVLQTAQKVLGLMGASE